MEFCEAVDNLRDVINAAIDYHSLPGGTFTSRYGKDFNLVGELQEALDEFDSSVGDDDVCAACSAAEYEPEPGSLADFINQAQAMIDQAFQLPRMIQLPPSSLPRLGGACIR